MSARLWTPQVVGYGPNKERLSAWTNRREATGSGPLVVTEDVHYFPPPDGHERQSLGNLQPHLIDLATYLPTGEEEVRPEQLATTLQALRSSPGQLIISGDEPKRTRLMTVLAHVLHDQDIGVLAVEVRSPTTLAQLPMLCALAQGWGVPVLAEPKNGFGPVFTEAALLQFTANRIPAVLGTPPGVIFQGNIPVINL